MADHEVLLLSQERLVEGVLFLREVVYASDHLVYTKVSWLTEPEDGWHSRGWRQVAGPQGEMAGWSEMAVLEDVARRAAAKGWTVHWHPADAPVLSEFRREKGW